MVTNIQQLIKSYFQIFKVVFSPKLCVKYLAEEEKEQQRCNINKIRKIYFEAFCMTLLALITAYILAGCPIEIPWHKLFPTLLISFPVYGSRNDALKTWGSASIAENADRLFFKTIYIIGITWLAWDIFKGII